VQGDGVMSRWRRFRHAAIIAALTVLAIVSGLRTLLGRNHPAILMSALLGLADSR
jgi:hypothetical protein